MAEMAEDWLDVLIVGGGAAGLRAAIEARRRRVERVAVICKGLAGRSGATVVSEGRISAAFGHSDPRDTPLKHFEDTLKEGCLLNDQRLVKALVEEAPARVSELEEFGVSLERSGGKLEQSLAPGHSYPRACNPLGLGLMAGRIIGFKMRSYAERIGVEFFDNHFVFKLLVDDDRVYGALALNMDRVAFRVLHAKATVLATGGAGWLYKHTTNPIGAVGDGYSLALRAGAELKDMEFVQFYPTLCLQPARLLVRTSVFGRGARLLNRSKEAFMTRYDRVRGDMAGRDVMSRAVFTEVLEGRGVDRGVYLDLSSIPKSLLEQYYKDYIEIFLRRGVDIRMEPVVVSPAAHFFMGGLTIDESCRSSLKGLYAVGEVAGGVHGASRLGGNALAEVLVFGAKAGAEAASLSLSESLKPHACDASVKEGVEWIKKLASGGGSIDLGRVSDKVRELAWSKLGIVRSGDEIKEALGETSAVKEELEKASVEGLREARKIMELHFMLDVAEIVGEAALAREESRGAHYREDYPVRDDEKWLGSILLKLKGGRVERSFIPFKQATSEYLMQTAG